MNIRFSDGKKIFNINRVSGEVIPYLSFDLLDNLGVPNLFTTRYISYDAQTGEGEKGLRLAAMKWEDITDASPVVRGNRDILARQLGSSIEWECITDQKHTNFVHVASREDLGLSCKPLHMQYVDGVVTDIPGVVLTVFGGDCPPVYIVDPVRKAIGLVHAGWRGTLGRIPEVAVANMAVRFGCDPADMYAAVGPGICRDCYEMGDEVYEAFTDKWSKEEVDRILSKYPAVDSDGAEIPGGKYHLDLREANRMTLMGAGIPQDHIEISNICTKCNSDVFYSYRARRMENEQVAMMVNRFR
jgi:YfiH family protein